MKIFLYNNLMNIMNNTANIRNFSIIAHIDHGKSTLSDAIMRFCGVELKENGGPSLDSMALEKERGITIKSHAVTIFVKHKKGEFVFNLHDSPGHLDFNNEVEKSISACEGSLLVVDSTQGIEAQTLCNLQKALNYNHVIIPIINKIDLPNADIEGVKSQIHELIGDIECIPVSAKTGVGIDKIIDAIIDLIPSPKADPNGKLQALVIDSWYNEYLGVSVLLCIKNGSLKKNQEVFMLSDPSHHWKIAKIGIFSPKPVDLNVLEAGQAGFLASFSKEISFKVGDTLTSVENPSTEALPGFVQSRCIVYCFFLIQDNSGFDGVKKALQKLQLNDSSFFFQHEHVDGWGVGFKCGFLGMLHLEIIKERLFREFNIDVMITSPSVTYKCIDKNNVTREINSASQFPIRNTVLSFLEPIVLCKIVTPSAYAGPVINFCLEQRGTQEGVQYLGNSVILSFFLPLNEIITNFHEKLCSLTNGYCSFDYEIDTFRESDLVKLEIHLNKDPIAVLSSIIHRSRAYNRGRKMCEQLKQILPRQQFLQSLQAVVDGKVVAREDISAFRKDVTAKCYGGDITRKKKLLEKQKKGKDRMQSLGKSVQIKTKDLIDMMKM
jgi:GTP-binding protein LepA